MGRRRTRGASLVGSPVRSLARTTIAGGAPTLDAAACPGGGRVARVRHPGGRGGASGTVQRQVQGWRRPYLRPRPRTTPRVADHRHPHAVLDPEERQGPRSAGWVTNNSDEVWSAVNVHAFVGEFPITSSSELAFQATRGPEESVGDRITVPGHVRHHRRSWRPGTSAPYIDKIPVEAPRRRRGGRLLVRGARAGHERGRPGRGWPTGGPARSSRYVPPKDRGRPIDTALVLPAAPPGAAHARRDAGRGRRLGRGPSVRAVGSRRSWTSGSRRAACPITWLVDPAVPDPAEPARRRQPRPRGVQRPRGRPERARSRRRRPRTAGPALRHLRSRAPPARTRRRSPSPWLAKLNRERRRQAGPRPPVGRRGRRRGGQAGRLGVYEGRPGLVGHGPQGSGRRR